MKQYANGVYCTAGMNYFVIGPNGGAFHCMADLEANLQPVFNVRDGWKPNTALARCPHQTCSGCDVPYITRWFQDPDGLTQNRIDRVWLNMVPETPEKPQTIAKSLTWLPTQMCNFSCVYCDYGNGKAFTHARYHMSNNELSVNEWLQAWAMIMDEVDYAAVTISGGEPTLSPAFYPVLELIGSKYLVNMTTNVSQSLLRLARHAPKKRLLSHNVFGQVYAGLDQINMSLHPTSRNFHEMTFKGNALMLKNAGFNVMVNFVGYPPQLYLASEYKDWCEKNDIAFMLLEWGNGDRMGNTPSYTREERFYLVSLTTHDRRVNAKETPVSGHSLDIDTKVIRLSRDGVASFRGTAINKSNFAWKRNSPLGVKIGARVYEQVTADPNWRDLLQSKRGRLVSELRADLEELSIAPGDRTSFEFQLRGVDFQPGFYSMLVDVVDEGMYWFSDRGAVPMSLLLHVS